MPDYSDRKIWTSEWSVYRPYHLKGQNHMTRFGTVKADYIEDARIKAMKKFKRKTIWVVFNNFVKR